MLKMLLNEILPTKLLASKKMVGFISRKVGCSKIKAFCKGKSVPCAVREDRCLSFVKQFKKMVSVLQWKQNQPYIYPYDPYVYRQINPRYQQLVSITPDFEVILKSDVRLLLSRLQLCKDKDFGGNLTDLVNCIETLANRISKTEHPKAKYFKTLLCKDPESLDEALQKLLFYDALFWQVNHRHVGLGRLDVVLYDYYARDIDRNVISRNAAKEMLVDFISILGYDTKFKSQNLIGDTGQYIMLGGGINENSCVCNELSYIFLEIFAERSISDPKLILRVNKNTPDRMWNAAIRTILKGNGSPLILNEDVVIPNMIQFGYSKQDVYNMGTSACWEPLIIGKSFDQNNPLPSIPIMRILNDMIDECKSYDDFAAFFDEFKQRSAIFVRNMVYDIDFDVSPLCTLFYDDCLRNEKDFSQGGARYAYHGIQIVSLPNVVNALLNIKQFVFEERLLTLNSCKEVLNVNFVGYDELRKSLKSNIWQFGSARPEVVSLTNDLMSFYGDIASKLEINGKKIKIGFSSPGYMCDSKGVHASMDGRLNDEPFAVHISPVSSKIDIAEILDFATQLNYGGNRINGNVVDFIIPRSYANKPEKLVAILKNACNKGLFEVQLNVLDVKILRDAKEHPERYANLVVRVWGFSAYFNDLPDEYKDYLIARAENCGC